MAFLRQYGLEFCGLETQGPRQMTSLTQLLCHLILQPQLTRQFIVMNDFVQYPCGDIGSARVIQIVFSFEPGSNGVVCQLRMILNNGRIDRRLENGSVNPRQTSVGQVPRVALSV